MLQLVSKQPGNKLPEMQVPGVPGVPAFSAPIGADTTAALTWTNLGPTSVTAASVASGSLAVACVAARFVFVASAFAAAFSARS